MGWGGVIESRCEAAAVRVSSLRVFDARSCPGIKTMTIRYTRRGSVTWKLNLKY